jgi:hypothetical protein
LHCIISGITRYLEIDLALEPTMNLTDKFVGV